MGSQTAGHNWVTNTNLQDQRLYHLFYRWENREKPFVSNRAGCLIPNSVPPAYSTFHLNTKAGSSWTPLLVLTQGAGGLLQGLHCPVQNPGFKGIEETAECCTGAQGSSGSWPILTRHQNLQLALRELIQSQQVGKPTQTFKERYHNKVLKERTGIWRAEGWGCVDMILAWIRRKLKALQTFDLFFYQLS